MTINLRKLGYECIQDLELPPLQNVQELYIKFQDRNGYDYYEDGEKE